MPWFVRADERIRTGRLVLEPLGVDDAEGMVDVMADPDLYTVIGGPPPTLQALRERYRQLSVGHSPDRSEQWLNWIVRVRDEDGGPGRTVWTVQATVMSAGTRAEVAWIIGTPWQRRGIGAESARAMVDWLCAAGVGHITAHVHPGHSASQAVARHAGMRPTDEYHDGEQRWVRGVPQAAPE